MPKTVHKVAPRTDSDTDKNMQTGKPSPTPTIPQQNLIQNLQSQQRLLGDMALS